MLGFALGALASYLLITILANLEDWQFYTLRSFVTGQESMSQIVAHPADRWVMSALTFGVPTMGGLLAMQLANFLMGRNHRDDSNADPS